MASKAKPEHGNTGNAFLDTLEPTSAAPILRALVRIDGKNGMRISDPRRPFEHITFPCGGMISAVARMDDGNDVEVSVIGCDGFHGFEVGLGHDRSAKVAMVQIPGPLWQIGRAEFEMCLRADGALKQRVLDYAMVCIETISQFSACNGSHSINRRLARWLLMSHDRVPGDDLILTQEFIATMLGVRRAGVTIAASALERDGLIAYSRGKIRIVDRSGLEAVACECYATAARSLETILGYSIRKSVAESSDVAKRA